MKIKNYKELNISGSRADVLSIYKAGVEYIEADRLVKKAVNYNKNSYSLLLQHNSFDIISGRIFVIGGGKASGKMAEVVEDIIGTEKIVDGIVNCPAIKYKTKNIKINKASHPIPDKNSIVGVKKMFELNEKYNINEKDIVLCLISGGASSMLTYPAEGLELKDLQVTTKLLIDGGLSIDEINIVRKHLSKVKGGQLGEHFSKARVISLIISDVIGNNVDVVGSGPTVADSSTFEKAYIILKKHSLWDKLPKSVVKHIEAGRSGEVGDTPKELDNCKNYIIGKNTQALEAMAHQAKSLGLKPLIVTSELSGEGKVVAEQMVKNIRDGKYKGFDVLLFGGETTFKLDENHGKGGRNQHFASLFMKYMKKYKGDWTVACVGSDGVDYTDKAAGAIIDKNSLKIVQELKLDINEYIKNFDSYTLFNKMGHSVINTGATETNVGDFVIVKL